MLYLIQFMMNFYEILENNKKHCQTIIQKISLFQKKTAFVDYFTKKFPKIFLNFLSHFVFFCLKSEGNQKFKIKLNSMEPVQ